MASLGFLATDGLPVFAVSPSWNSKKKPNLIIKKEMERIWGEPYDDVWHKTVKGYHFFGFGWPAWPDEMGLSAAEHLPYKGWLYNDTKDEGMSGCAYHHYSLHFTELVRRELEARRLDPKKNRSSLRRMPSTPEG